MARDALRRLAKTRHPDTGGDPDHFALLLDAYATLRTPEVQVKNREGRRNFLILQIRKVKERISWCESSHATMPEDDPRRAQTLAPLQAELEMYVSELSSL